ncbi:hypothetical protein P3W45_001640 [Vairimorpha bombi]
MSHFKIELLNDSKKPEIDNGIYRCYAYEDGVIPPKTGSLINLGFKLQVPKEYFIHVFSTSVKSLGGVGDSDYRGIYNLIVYNDKDTPLSYKKNEYVGNFCLIKVKTPVIEVINE